MKTWLVYLGLTKTPGSVGKETGWVWSDGSPACYTNWNKGEKEPNGCGKPKCKSHLVAAFYMVRSKRRMSSICNVVIFIKRRVIHTYTKKSHWDHGTT